MSTFKVTAERLTVHPHPNADLLELAQVGGYRSVIAKGSFKTGDIAIYIPEQSILPDELIEELGLVGKLAGKEKNRVKAVRLRGELSQGIVCWPKELHCPPDELEALGVGSDSHDYAEQLGIRKWVPAIPVEMAGQVEPAPELLRWVDIEDIKRYPTIFEPGEAVTATEKTHGTCCLLTYVVDGEQTIVTSKGLGEKHLAIKKSDSNLYWRAVLAYDLDMAAQDLARMTGAAKVGIYGEVYGQGVQDLHYGRDARQAVPGYVVFDVRFEHADGETEWMDQDELAEFFKDWPVIRVAPRLYDGPYDYELLAKLAEGREQLSGAEANIKEGLVIRPQTERTSDVTGHRAIAKLINPAYLLRDGGTEFE